MTKPRAVLGLAADNGAANAELVLLSIIVIAGDAKKTIDEDCGVNEFEKRCVDGNKLLDEIYSIAEPHYLGTLLSKK